VKTLGNTKIRVTAFLDKKSYDESLSLKERHEKLVGTKMSDSSWFALLIKDGLPNRKRKIEGMEG